MFTVAIIGQKGGSGKTTVALGLATTAAAVGEEVAVIDLDPQASATKWKDRRTVSNPAVVSAQVSRLRPTLDAAKASGADLVVIDSPGKNDSAAVEAARVADLVLIATRPGVFDMETLPAIRDLVRIAGDPPAYVVFNHMHPQGNRIADEFKGLTLNYADLASCPFHLCQRASYADAPTAGKAVQEVDPEGKAAAELQQLYLWVKSELKKKGKHHEKTRHASRA
jgi:chromosome partitioning protein